MRFTSSTRPKSAPSRSICESSVSVVARRAHDGPHPSAECDVCHERLYGSRTCCIECGSGFTFDFCNKPACLETTVKRDDVKSPHLPTHDLVKMRTAIMHYREIGKILRRSEAGLTRARAILRKASAASADTDTAGEDDTHNAVDPAERAAQLLLETALAHPTEPGRDKPEKAPDLTCVSCSEPVALPCWYCIDCPGTSSSLRSAAGRPVFLTASDRRGRGRLRVQDVRRCKPRRRSTKLCGEPRRHSHARPSHRAGWRRGSRGTESFGK